MPVLPDICRLCGAQNTFAFSGRVLGHAVKSSAINDADTGIMWRSLQNVPRVIGTLLAFGKLKGRIVDHALLAGTQIK